MTNSVESETESSRSKTTASTTLNGSALSPEIPITNSGSTLYSTETAPPQDSPINEELNSYQYLLKTTSNNIGRNAFGIVAIEVWMLNNRNAKLKCATGAMWRNPYFETSDLLSQLEDASVEGYLPQTPVMQGMGVAGSLYAEEMGDLSSSTTTWRDLRQLALDPDRPYCPRLQVQAEVFGLAKGFYYEHRATETSGIVIFFARKTADTGRLSNYTNTKYFRASADLLGSLVSWEKPRDKSISESKESTKAAWARARLKIRTLTYFKMDLFRENKEAQAQNQRKSNFFNKYRNVVNVKVKIYLTKFKGVGLIYLTKFKGVGLKIPPSTKIPQCVFVFLGCFTSLLTLVCIDHAIQHRSDDKLRIILAPLGALVTCHYGLTNAPASQPRNGILGMILCSTIANASTYIPLYIFPIWFRAAFIPALTITLTLALGIVHPPAGAMAVLFATNDKPDWTSFLLLLFGYVMANIYAVLFINLHGAMTFPLYWGFWIQKKEMTAII